MFEKFFGFLRTPFARDLKPADLFGSEDSREATSRLEWAVLQRGIALLTGDVGSGKSTCLRLLEAGLDPVRHRLIYISNPLIGARGIFRQILLALGQEPHYHKAEAFRQLKHALWASCQDGKMAVIAVDDAHMLGEDVLQEFRFMANFEVDSASPFALVLTGHTPLRDRLGLSTYQHLAQRLTVQYHMRGLTAPETKEYINHHLRVAGCSSPLFTPEAVNEVFAYTRGIPRRINRVCQNSLLAACIEQKELIDHSLVLRVIHDLDNP